MKNYYTIAIKRRFFPLWEKYKVISHWCESSDIAIDGTPLHFPMRMAMRLPDQTVLCLPNIAARQWKLYPDYVEFMRRIDEAKQPKAIAEEQT